jgi:hypothetical protein
MSTKGVYVGTLLIPITFKKAEIEQIGRQRSTALIVATANLAGL